MLIDVESTVEWDKEARRIREIIESLLKEHFGDRCPDFNENCIICHRYNLLKQLLANPYAD